MRAKLVTLQLSKFLDVWLEVLDKLQYIDAIYCISKFIKTFDKVTLKCLIHNLEMYKFGRKYIK